jgi:transposase InsO family protein
MDAYSRLIVGWSIADHMRTELVTDALGMAIIRRQPEKRPADAQTILHSDRGAQYADRVLDRHHRMELAGRAAAQAGLPRRHPKLPQVLPRYLPVDVDRRLTQALIEHPGTSWPRPRCGCNAAAGCASASCS